MTPLHPVARRFRWLSLAIAITVLLAGCTLDDDTDPDPTAAPTAVTFGPDDVAVGTLLEESSAAWDGVDAWTVETRIESPGSGSGNAATSVSTERVAASGERQVRNMTGENLVSEEIFVGGRIYMRGTLVSSSIYPEVDDKTWISFTSDQVPPDTALDQRVTYLTTPAAFPFATVTAETRALPASPAGEVQLGDRVCTVYQFTTSEIEGEGIEHRIAFDAEKRPCQLVREGGGVIETTVWTYSEVPEPITPPEEVVEVDTFPTVP
ncbi:MAG TPA: hypothetical protein VD789_01865 [Thermomicrobiales bacterium]|nr:hypothetical protein [Thermomicrobiales bacterium]